MKKEQAKELIKVIQGWIDGKTIQSWCKEINKWIDLNEKCSNVPQNFFSFGDQYSDNPDWKVRIKPEPREFWLVLPKEGWGKVYYYNPKDEYNQTVQIVHVKEILSD